MGREGPSSNLGTLTKRNTIGANYKREVVMDNSEKTIPGFPDYSITKDGKVFSFKYREKKRLRECQDKKGYFKVDLRIAGKGHTRAVHRLVLETFVGPCPLEQEARHLNGNRTDNRLENLSWGTREENAEDKVRHGTATRGEKNGNSKLTIEQVCKIRELHKNGETQKKIGEKFGIAYQTVGGIVRGEAWTRAGE